MEGRRKHGGYALLKQMQAKPRRQMWVGVGALVSVVVLVVIVLREENRHSPSLAASPRVLNNSHGEYVMLTWHSIVDPTSKDWIGIYSPSTSADEDYFDWIQPDGSGYGSDSYYLVNMRTDYGFRYFRYDYSSKKYIKEASAGVTFSGGPNQPLQGHLALTDNSDEMRVMWITDSSTTPKVMYGTESNLYLFNATGTSSTYTASMMCGAPANVTSAQNFRPPGFNHDVLLSGLIYSTIYYYRFGNDEDGYSPEYSFKSRPSPLAPTTGPNFLIYGDMGTYDYRCYCDGALATAAKITDDSLRGYIYDFAMHIGDISYGRGRSYLWDQFLLQIEPIATRVPYMIGIGNHDYVHSADHQDPSGIQGNGFHPSWGNYGDDSDGECSIPTYFKFHMPNATSNNKMSPFWYSYDSSLAHFVVISTEHNFTLGSEQYTWLENDLITANQNRATVPWIILFGHRPMYESEDYPSDSLVALHIRSSIEDLLFNYKVNLAIWGHYHSYQRTCPVYQAQCIGDNEAPGATVHVTVGSAGADLDNANYLNVSWAEVSTYNWGYSRASIINSTTLLFEFIATNLTDPVDSFYLSRW